MGIPGKEEEYRGIRFQYTSSRVLRVIFIIGHTSLYVVVVVVVVN